MISLMTIAWLSAFGGYAFCLYRYLSVYLVDAGNHFWTYYGLAIALPSIWGIVQYIRFFFVKEEEDLFPLFEDERPLFEQMIRQEP